MLICVLYTFAGAKREQAMRFAARVFGAAVLCQLAAACSLTMPIASLSKDDDITGSISKPEPILSSKLNAEDWRRAQSALGLAVDPQGNGAPVSWDNPESGMKGSFVAAGPLYLLEDRVCRSFVATLNAPSTPSQMQGSTCRLGPNEWQLREIKPWNGPN